MKYICNNIYIIKPVFNLLYSFVDGHKLLPYSSISGQLCLTLCYPMGALQAPLSMGFFRQEHWSGLPFPSPGDLPDPETEPVSPT